MYLSSVAFKNNDFIPNSHAFKQDNISPPLDFGQIPENAKSLCLIVRDPDAPSGNFVHWLVWNINPTLTNIESNDMPDDAVQGKNDFGNTKWDGPAPPSGTHHYYFELYALNKTINLPINATKLELERAMAGCILDKATLCGLHSAQ